jgi:hypothetical protein
VNVSITDEIIDAIIQNERRHAGHPGKALPSVWMPQASSNQEISKRVLQAVPEPRDH